MDSNQRVVLLGLEDSDGQIDGSLQVIETLAGLSFASNGEVKERNLVRSSLSDAGAVIGAKNFDITLPTELKGAGMDGATVKTPQMSAAFLACGMVLDAAAMLTINSVSGSFSPGEMLTNTTASNAIGKVAHVISHTGGTQTLWLYGLDNAPTATDAISGDQSTATATVSSIDDALCYRLTSDRSEHRTCQIHANFDKTRRIARRGRATMQFDFQAGEQATVQFTVKALYDTPTDSNLPDAQYSDLLPPIGESAGLTIAGYDETGTIEKLSFQLGNELVPVPDINSPNGRHSFRIKSRKPTGSIDPEVVKLSDFNPFSLWENGTKSALHATLGNAPGERISVVLPQAQFTGVKDKERAGLNAYDLPYRATGSLDNEFYLFFH